MRSRCESAWIISTGLEADRDAERSLGMRHAEGFADRSSLVGIARHNSSVALRGDSKLLCEPGIFNAAYSVF
jgi:hypothetical protein